MNASEKSGEGGLGGGVDRSWPDYNAIGKVITLRNRYIALRHGESEANSAGIIASDPARAGFSMDLTAAGREEVSRTCAGLRGIGGKPLIVTSDFARARSSADIAARILDGASTLVREELRERFFGDLEGGPDMAYAAVWERDAQDPFHHEYGVESAIAVYARTSRLVMELEGAYSGQSIVLVSHGDPLQILQCAFEKICPSGHRSLPHLKTAAARELSPRS